MEIVVRGKLIIFFFGIVNFNLIKLRGAVVGVEGTGRGGGGV